MAVISHVMPPSSLLGWSTARRCYLDHDAVGGPAAHRFPARRFHGTREQPTAPTGKTGRSTGLTLPAGIPNGVKSVYARATRFHQGTLLSSQETNVTVSRSCHISAVVVTGRGPRTT